MTKKILMVMSNISEIDSLNKTGVWFKEFAVPYIGFQAQGYEITVASLDGGMVPVDEESYDCASPMEWDSVKKYLDSTEKLLKIDYMNYDAIVFPGGHGVMFDMAESEFIGEIVSHFYNSGKLIATICHGTAALLNAKKENGDYIVKNRYITSFTDKEEHITYKDELMPFLLQRRLVELGAKFVEQKPKSIHVEIDRNIVTAQNAESSYLFTDTIISYLKH